ncbi:MAG TPA: DJ-1/PfpI family protein [Haliangiales bacterium]|nr:DJ-1/PfpI family protein [Haliangiales bacterium]
MRFGFVAFPRLTQLDLAGPHEVLSRLPGAEALVVAATRDPIAGEFGLRLQPDATFADAPPLDAIMVPGGPGIDGAIADDRLMAFLAERAPAARWVTAVCTGSLVLGAAGLLRGYRATTHWLSLDLLPLVGAIPIAERVVVDRNRVTGGGVTAGIDFGLRLAAELAGEAVAQRIQLVLEYDPAPPFAAGSPRTAPAAVVEDVRARRAGLQAERRALLERRARMWA